MRVATPLELLAGYNSVTRELREQDDVTGIAEIVMYLILTRFLTSSLKSLADKNVLLVRI